MEALTSLPDGSMALAMEHIEGRRLDALAPGDIDADLLDSVWQETRTLHRARIAHRSLHVGNILVDAGSAVIVDFSFAEESADERLRAIDRAELCASMAALVGPKPVIASAQRTIGSDDLAAALPYLQPLALSASTRARASKSLLKELRENITATTGKEPVPLERLIRVRPKTVLTIAALAGAFYFLLPQLANVPDSLRAAQVGRLGMAGRLRRDLACLVRGGGDQHVGERQRQSADRGERAGAAGLVIREPGHAGQRRRHGAQCALHAEVRHRAGGSGHRHGSQRGWWERSCTSCSSSPSSAWAGQGGGKAFKVPASSRTAGHPRGPAGGGRDLRRDPAAAAG